MSYVYIYLYIHILIYVRERERDNTRKLFHLSKRTCPQGIHLELLPPADIDDEHVSHWREEQRGLRPTKVTCTRVHMHVHVDVCVCVCAYARVTSHIWCVTCGLSL